MKRKTLLLSGITVLGAGLFAAGLGLLGNFGLPDNASKVMINIGGLMAIRGAFTLWTGFLEAMDPAYQKQNRIERTDERNIVIRNRAKALTGDILQWCVLSGAVLAVGLDAPIWVGLLAVVVFELKEWVEAYLIGRYQEEM